jgi:hypothetical protein
MLHAVEAPLLKMVAVAGAAVLAGTLLAPEREHKIVQRLELHAPERCDAIYLTKWRHGDVVVSLRDATPSPMTFKTRARVWDGCEWLGIETLTPDGPNRYFYRYEEQVLSCAPGAKPTGKTPRTGYVLVVDQHED